MHLSFTVLQDQTDAMTLEKMLARQSGNQRIMQNDGIDIETLQADIVR